MTRENSSRSGTLTIRTRSKKGSFRVCRVCSELQEQNFRIGFGDAWKWREKLNMNGAVCAGSGVQSLGLRVYIGVSFLQLVV